MHETAHQLYARMLATWDGQQSEDVEYAIILMLAQWGEYRGGLDAVHEVAVSAARLISFYEPNHSTH